LRDLICVVKDLAYRTVPTHFSLTYSPVDNRAIDSSKAEMESDILKNLNTEFWIPESEDDGIEYSAYWNNEENEKAKEWYILDDNFSKMESYLGKTGLIDDLERYVNILKNDFQIKLGGNGVESATTSKTGGMRKAPKRGR